MTCRHDPNVDAGRYQVGRVRGCSGPGVVPADDAGDRRRARLDQWTTQVNLRTAGRLIFRTESQMRPNASIASDTRRKPATFAPTT